MSGTASDIYISCQPTGSSGEPFYRSVQKSGSGDNEKEGSSVTSWLPMDNPYMIVFFSIMFAILLYYMGYYGIYKIWNILNTAGTGSTAVPTR